MKLAPQSVRWRLTLWYSAALGVMLAAFAIGSFTILRRVMDRRIDDFLSSARDAFGTELAAEVAEIPEFSEAVRAAQRDVYFRDIDFLVYNPRTRDWTGGRTDSVTVRRGRNGELIPSYEPDQLAEQIRSQPVRSAVLLSLPDNEGGYRVALRNVEVAGSRYTIAALQSQQAHRETLADVALAFSLSVPLFLFVACLGGYGLARRSLAPLAAMSRQARAITATNLHERLPVTNPRDELGALSTIVNDLLGRLESAFQQQRRFVADASHELRTPVAIIRVESDLALNRIRSEAEYRDVLHVVQDASDRLSRIVDDLFLLARADAGRQPVRQEEIYLNEVVSDAARGMRALAAQRDIDIELSSLDDAPARGDPELIGRLLLNLLDNAIKYSSAGSTVTISLREREQSYQVSVLDRGRGIPAEALPFVFDRFYRVDKARSRSDSSLTSGAGLGLALARWIAEAHGGRLEIVRSDTTGSEFLFTLPAVQVGAPDPILSQV